MILQNLLWTPICHMPTTFTLPPNLKAITSTPRKKSPKKASTLSKNTTEFCLKLTKSTAKRRRSTLFYKTGNYSHKKLTTSFFGSFWHSQLSPVAFSSSFCPFTIVENYYEPNYAWWKKNLSSKVTMMKHTLLYFVTKFFQHFRIMSKVKSFGTPNWALIFWAVGNYQIKKWVHYCKNARKKQLQNWKTLQYIALKSAP